MRNAQNLVIAAAVPFVVPGAVKKNTDAVIRALSSAKEKGASLAVLPLNCLTGEIGSMRLFPSVIKAVLGALNRIANNTDIPAVIGFPYREYDCAAFIEKHKVRGFTILGAETENLINPFPDSPFRLADAFETEFGRLLLCGEDVLYDSPRMFDSTDIIAVPAAYPALMGGFARKKNQACRLSFRNGGCFVVVACAGAGESTHKFVRSGDKIVAGYSQILAASTGDSEEIVIGARDKSRKPNNNMDAPYIPSYLPQKGGCGEVFDILSRGISGRMRESGCRRVILGLSGGLDSACVLIAAVNTFDKYGFDRKDILAVTMPGASSGDRTRSNADILIERLGVTGLQIPIETAVRRHLRQLGHNKKDVVYENAQARERAQILLDLSNKYGALLLGTSDMSECALGFSTYGGDSLAHYNPVNCLTKSAIRVLLRNFADNDAALIQTDCPQKAENQDTPPVTLAECIKDILDTPVSPELKKDQETEKILGPYELHDFFLLRLLAYNESAAEIVAGAENAFPKYRNDIKKYYRLFINRFFKNRFKGAFACDGIQLTPFDLCTFDINWSFDKNLFEI